MHMRSARPTTLSHLSTRLDLHQKVKRRLSATRGTVTLHLTQRKRYKHLTTFITPWGRYRYRTTQGYIASGNGYPRRFVCFRCTKQNKMYRRCPTLFRRSRVKLLSGMQLVRHMWKAWDHSKPQQIVFGEDTVEFAGFEITRDIVRPSN